MRGSEWVSEREKEREREREEREEREEKEERECEQILYLLSIWVKLRQEKIGHLWLCGHWEREREWERMRESISSAETFPTSASSFSPAHPSTKVDTEYHRACAADSDWASPSPRCSVWNRRCWHSPVERKGKEEEEKGRKKAQKREEPSGRLWERERGTRTRGSVNVLAM